jgi:glycosyltransferase involved in cell wall biosynthesis
MKKVTLLTGGHDIQYALGLLSGLINRDMIIEFIGNNVMEKYNLSKHPDVKFYNLRGDQSPGASLIKKAFRVIGYYSRLITYTTRTDSKIFHILWLNKFLYFDRTLLNIYYKILGKRIIYTAHDLNYRKLVGRDTLLNRITLWTLYTIVDRIIVQTNKMKHELVQDFHVNESKIKVIQFGIHNILPETDLTTYQAREQLNLHNNTKVLLFFGNIAPYKGIEYLFFALDNLKTNYSDLKLVIAGRIKVGCDDYWTQLKEIIQERNLQDRILKRIEFIPDNEVEIYFKAADVLILPYKYIFQSGLIFTSYRFGLPVIATDVGELRDLIHEGKTGLICKPQNSIDLANQIINFYNGDLYKSLARNRTNIIRYGQENFSWRKSGHETYNLYSTFFLGHPMRQEFTP